MIADLVLFINFIILYVSFVDLAGKEYLEYRLEERDYRKMLDANKGTVNPFTNMLVITI